MIQIKKTILTLVALLAVTTGAWADETLLLTIESKDYADFKSGSKTFDDKVTVTFSNSVYNDGDGYGWYAGGTASLLTVAGINGYTITSCKFYTDIGTAANGYTVEGESPSVYLYDDKVFTDNSQSVFIGSDGIKKIEVYGTAASSASGPKVAWDKAAKTGTFTMPGGNVTLEPEYYPQATVADGGVTAADADARATTDDPLVKVDATKLTGAKKLMYFVSNSGTTAPAYDAEGWTDQLPTAEGFTQQGIVYVWYYPVGIDEGVDGATATYSDGDICLQSITARIAPEPTYAVTFAEGTDPNERTADPAADVKKGQTVTVTYTGSKKVIGVKAEKKAAASLIVNPVVGQVIGSDGKNYDANATLPDGVTALAKIAYVGSDNGEAAPYNHGLALALSDANDGSTYQWSTGFADAHGYKPTNSSFTSESGLQYNASHNSDTYPAFKAAITYSPAAPTGCSAWFLASGYQWQKMAGPVGGLTNLGFQGWVYYWTSTEYNPGTSAWRFSTGTGDWFSDYKNNDSRVRACLAF